MKIPKKFGIPKTYGHQKCTVCNVRSVLVNGKKKKKTICGPCKRMLK